MPKMSEPSTPPADNTPPNMSPNTYDGGAALPDVEAGATATGNPAAAGSGAATRPSTARGNIAARRGQFMIAARRPNGLQPLGMQPLNFAYIEQTLRGAPDIDVVDTVGPKSIMGALADGISDTPSVLVAQMTEQKASVLHQQAQGRMIVERDNHLTLMDPVLQPPPLVVGAVPSGSATLATVVTVLGKDNAPVRDAEVYLFGSFMPGTGVTDERGQVTVTLFGETVQTVRGLYVKPKADYWSFYQTHPAISTSEENIVILRALADWPALQNFPQQQVLGWGQKAMRLDQVPGSYRGQGVKVAVIDSGAATSHDDLRNVKFGFDILNKKTNPNSWNEDSIAHGSHCTGIIAGADNTHGVRGFAPDAEIHECKLFPGGQVSQLIDALEYCIEQQIDVANLSLGGVPPSEALEQQILRAKRAGVACIVAAGNSGGAVQYPASSPNVLAVSAVGKLNEFPSDSYHTQTLTTMVDANGFFAPKFTCFGPEVGVCGPGVAITSSVPPNNFAVWDGTSMATPHITGLAALVLAHHNDFQGSYKARTAERVERLFQIIKQSARRLNLGDPRMTGYGLPDAVSALKLGAQAGQQVAGVAAAATPQAMLTPMQAAYNDQVAYAQQQQAALNNQWAQLANPYGPALAVMGFDPGGGFASGLIPPLYHYRPGLAPSAFGQGW